MALTMASAGEAGKNGLHILIIVQNLPVPFDRRVWQEATTLSRHGYTVSVICPKGKGYEATYELIDDIHIFRHPLPKEGNGPFSYFFEYTAAFCWEFLLTCKIFFSVGFDAIQACNPPDTIFLIGGFFRVFFDKKFVFDHHDLSPELYEAKFRKRDFFYHLLRRLERLTFKTAHISIATNESYRQIAIERGRMPPEDVFIVRSGPDLKRIHRMNPVPALKSGRKYLVGYLGVMGGQEGIEYLIEAARILVYDMKRTDISFALAGSGPDTERLKKLAAIEGVSDYMNFMGRVPDKELLQMLSTADVCVNPDEVNEMNDKSTMNKIMEYMAVGKPIVQFDVTEGRFSAQEASLYARPNDAQDFAEKIAELLSDPARREGMGNAGRLRVETELAWTFEEPKLIAAYDALFKSNA